MEIPVLYGPLDTVENLSAAFRSDYNNARVQLGDRISQQYTAPLLSLQAWTLLGLNYGPVEEFLNHYMALANEWRLAYQQADWPRWRDEMKNRYGYKEDIIEIYLRNFRDLYSEGKIKKSIYEPWTGEAQTLPERVLKTIGSGFRWIFFGVVGVALAYGVFKYQPWRKR